MNDSNSCTDCEIGSDCFKKLIPSELEFITQKKTKITYNKGESICKQGAYASYVLYVSSGLAKLYLENNNKKHTNIQIVKSTEFIGLSSIFGSNIYDYSVAALKESNICLINKDGLKKLLNSNGSFASSVINRYCNKENLLFEKIKSIGYKQMNGRLADTLLYLSSDGLKNEKVFRYINRQDIADFSCISKESTVKLLGEFHKEGIIEVNGKEIKIIDRQLLNTISKTG